ncbi:hypothetical protein Hsw_1202 [Hymenobacter swuensis DY53]|uniref:Uncharacterized protein n=1 Tax=Hymenobacter swuensis DY53 TaxID=1227739 RepID=W8EYE9_9BACT|nr:hypothetical protein Hsw_1202 [Hymenobacter swuensis DY53]
MRPWPGFQAPKSWATQRPVPIFAYLSMIGTFSPLFPF